MALTGDKFSSDTAKCTFFKNGWYERIRLQLRDWENIKPIPREFFN
ncbi:MAG: hypothetical protein NC253_05935 [Ruminococcus sp.]|nr:hypothetical protein [Ruminococcus sp.]MCM1382229.1 hypothetical protein [Muribaculaceae bacterium]MCM1480796.1 hypothetical protein [Muribaculaceae bacterium]